MLNRCPCCPGLCTILKYGLVLTEASSPFYIHHHVLEMPNYIVFLKRTIVHTLTVTDTSLPGLLFSDQFMQVTDASRIIMALSTAWRNLENNALSSLYKLFLIRQVKGWVKQPPPPHKHTQSLAGSVTINTKTTTHCSPGSTMVQREPFKKRILNGVFYSCTDPNPAS